MTLQWKTSPYLWLVQGKSLEILTMSSIDASLSHFDPLKMRHSSTQYGARTSKRCWKATETLGFKLKKLVSCEIIKSLRLSSWTTIWGSSILRTRRIWYSSPIMALRAPVRAQVAPSHALHPSRRSRSKYNRMSPQRKLKQARIAPLPHISTGRYQNLFLETT